MHCRQFTKASKNTMKLFTGTFLPTRRRRRWLGTAQELREWGADCPSSGQTALSAAPGPVCAVPRGQGRGRCGRAGSVGRQQVTRRAGPQPCPGSRTPRIPLGSPRPGSEHPGPASARRWAKGRPGTGTAPAPQCLSGQRRQDVYAEGLSGERPGRAATRALGGHGAAGGGPGGLRDGAAGPGARRGGGSGGFGVAERGRCRGASAAPVALPGRAGWGAAPGQPAPGRALLAVPFVLTPRCDPEFMASMVSEWHRRPGGGCPARSVCQRPLRAGRASCPCKAEGRLRSTAAAGSGVVQCSSLSTAGCTTHANFFYMCDE